jgi:hypothetical protein
LEREGRREVGWMKMGPMQERVAPTAISKGA